MGGFLGQIKNWHFLVLDCFILCSVYFDNYHFLVLGLVQIGGGRIRQLDIEYVLFMGPSFCG